MNKQVAIDLNISLRTVENARARIMRKLNLEHIGQAAAMESEVRVLASVLEPLSKQFARASE